MKGFIVSIITLAVIICATAYYKEAWNRETKEIMESVSECRGEADEANALRIRGCAELIKQKRVFLHLALRQSRIEALLTTLNSAYSYCLAGDAGEMRRCVFEAERELEEWNEAERISLWTLS